MPRTIVQWFQLASAYRQRMKHDKPSCGQQSVLRMPAPLRDEIEHAAAGYRHPIGGYPVELGSGALPPNGALGPA
jgi:hypothetical protein